jgi:hypothetical protein
MKIISVKNYLRYLMVLMVMVIAVVSCEYETIEIDLPDQNEPVSFSEDIIPIFSSGDNCTGCHGSGGTSPNLTPSQAYTSIVPNLVNLADPASSKVYLFPNASTATHSFKSYTPVEAALILAWITQGAENN